MQKSWQWKSAFENGTGPSPNYLLFRELNEIASVISICAVAMPATGQHQVFRKVSESAQSFMILLHGGS